MATFFHGWRRKAGLVTLALACAILGLTFQSSSTVHAIITEPVDNGISRSQDIFEASPTELTWEHYDFPFRSGDYGQGCRSRSDVHFYRSVCESKKRDWRWQFCGFDVGEYKLQSDLWFRRIYLVVPIYSISLVLSLASAWLLLNKNRQKLVEAPRTCPALQRFSN